MTLWAGLTDLWSERRLRRGIVRELKPLFEFSRTQPGETPEERWRSDYGLGLIAMLVLVTAQRSDPDLGSEALGRLQVDSWADLTGLEADDIGTRITLLSASDDPSFTAGCRAALAFNAAARAERASSEHEGVAALEHAAADQIALHRDLWLRAWRPE